MKSEWNHAIDLCIQEAIGVLWTFQNATENTEEAENFEAACDELIHRFEMLKEKK